MAGKLTDEASAEIAEAVRIVREDKFELFVRGKVKPTEPVKDGPPAPPKKDAPTEPEKEVKRRGLWWGESEEDPDPGKETQ